MSLSTKIIPALIFWGIWILVIFYVPYPESLTQASLWQILAFFIPLFLALTFTLSAPVALGIVFLTLLKALDTLNFVSAILIIVAVGLLLSYFKRGKGKHNLTSIPGISKLTHLYRKRQ